MVDAVDLAANEDADPAVAPLAPVGQQEWNEQSQPCKHKRTLYRRRLQVSFGPFSFSHVSLLIMNRDLRRAFALSQLSLNKHRNTME